MRESYLKLISLIDSFPRYNSIRGIDVLSKVLFEYKTILDFVNNSNENYKRSTNLYYTEISGIEFCIHQSQYAKSKRQKDQSFTDAINGLKSDIESLIDLIAMKESF